MAKYLGVWLGPAAPEQQWTAPIESWRTSGRLIATSSMAASVLTTEYNMKAITKLSYLSQFMRVPDSIYRKEAGTLHTLLKLPNNAFSSNLLFNLEAIGGPKLSNIRATNAAAMLRFY
eukprot:590389-Karenia_brevis.AAC.1